MTAWFGKRIKLPRGGPLFKDVSGLGSHAHFDPSKQKLHHRPRDKVRGTLWPAGKHWAQPHFNGMWEKVIRRWCTQKLLIGHNTPWTWVFVKEHCTLYYI
jgi:hypothetical protein